MKNLNFIRRKKRMKKNSIEIIFESGFIDVLNLKPSIIIVWRNRQGKFFEFTLRISNEYFQDLQGIEKDTTPYDLIIAHPDNSKEISLEELQKKCKDESDKIWIDDLNKKLIPYIRNEKLNKLIN